MMQRPTGQDDPTERRRTTLDPGRKSRRCVELPARGHIAGVESLESLNRKEDRVPFGTFGNAIGLMTSKARAHDDVMANCRGRKGRRAKGR